MTKHDAIKHLSYKIAYAEQCDDEWVDSVSIKALYIAVRAMAEERKKGKWIRITQGAIPEQYICPFCRRTVESYGVEELLSIRYPYCHCGADMREEKTDAEIH